MAGKDCVSRQIGVAMAQSSRLSLAFTSWFRVPEQGMTRFELLSRASAFAVTAQRAPATAVHIVAAMHVPCPYLFPNYYPPTEYPWLAAVKDTHVESRVEFRKVRAGRPRPAPPPQVTG